jgi:pimeloyl-ACP methyl ester carboxylesterase
MELLAADFTLIAWDAPGWGGSDDPPPSVHLSYYADALAGLIRGLGIDRPDVLGLSFGGGLAIELVHRHPDLARSLVLVGAYAGWAGSLPPDEVADRLSRMLEESTQPPEQWVDSYLPGFFVGSVERELIDEVRAIMCDSRASGLVPMLTAFAEADLREVLPTITIPTLLLYGELDARAPLRIAEQLHARIPASQLRVIPGVGHCCSIEAPDVFASEVRSFLTGLATDLPRGT